MNSIDTVLSTLQTQGSASAGDIAHARSVAREMNDRPDRVLVRLGLLTEQKLFDAYQAALGIEPAPREALKAQDVAEGRISLKYLKTDTLLPVAMDTDEIVVATADPLNTYAEKALRLATARKVRFCLAPETVLNRTLDTMLDAADASDDIDSTTGMQGDQAAVADAEMLKDLASRAPVIQFVEDLFARAAAARASDIHIEPFERVLHVRFRIDGILQDADERPIGQAQAILSRLKILAGLDIGESRLPQDGRTKIIVEGRRMDVRLATTPTVFGERAVLRLLDADEALLRLDGLGLSPSVRTQVDRILSDPHGLFLVTGPTGSGKTTTLYAALQALNRPDFNIVTVEDPVEYQVPGINQVQVKPQIGLTFASILRSLVRQDPDVIMIGEIRDPESADIAIHAALAGRLVLSTVHTNSAAATVMRLLDMQAEPYLLSSVLAGAMSQRLVRKLCPHCREPYAGSPALHAEFGVTPGSDRSTFYRAKGCAECGGTGYRGRVAISEIMVPDSNLREAINSRTDATTLEKHARDAGMVPLLRDGYEKALAGETSIEEILRVVKT